jgi:hypothetical protein
MPTMRGARVPFCACVPCALCREQISRYSSDQQKVLQLPHLQGNTAVQQGLDADTSSVSAELRLLQARITAEGEGLDDFREVCWRRRACAVCVQAPSCAVASA